MINRHGAVAGIKIDEGDQVLVENLPCDTLSTTNFIWPDLGSNPGRRGTKWAANCQSYNTALEIVSLISNLRIRIALVTRDSFSAELLNTCKPSNVPGEWMF
jgi:hypothetical protein